MPTIAQPPTAQNVNHNSPPKLTDADKNLTAAQKVEKLLSIKNDPNKPEDVKRHQDLESFMQKMKVTGQSSTGETLLLQGQSGATIQVSSGGVGFDLDPKKGAFDTPANIEAAIELSLTAKKTFGNTLVEPLAPTIMEQQLMREIAKRVGINVGDTSKDAPMNAELKAKLDETWEKVKDKYNLPSMNPTVAAAPQAPAPVMPPPAPLPAAPGMVI